MKPYAPLGLLYVSAYVRAAGIAVEVFDTTFSTRDALSARLASPPAGVLGVYTNLITRTSVLDIVRRPRQTVGPSSRGPEAANFPPSISRRRDVVIIGEGEETLVELIPVLDARGPNRLHASWERYFGTRRERSSPTPTARKIRRSTPAVARSRSHRRGSVRGVWPTQNGTGASVHPRRAAVLRCRWCSHAVFGYTHRRRSVAGTADSWNSWWSAPPDIVWYADDVFTINHRWLTSTTPSSNAAVSAYRSKQSRAPIA